MKALKQLLEDIHRIAQDMQTIATCISANREMDVNVSLSQDDRDLMSNWRRRQAKKVQG